MADQEFDFFFHEEDGLHSVICGRTAHTVAGVEVVGVGFARSSDKQRAVEDSKAIATIELVERLTLQSEGLNSEKTRLSYSNGAAAGVDAGLARYRSKRELIERHRVLWAWYSGRAPKRLSDELLVGRIPSSSFSVLDWRLYDFGDGVTGVFALPIDPKGLSVPVFGFGSDYFRDVSIAKAAKEAFQRWMVLGDAPRESVPENVQATPGFHQDLFLSTEGMSVLKSWLDGNAKWSYEDALNVAFSEDLSSRDFSHTLVGEREVTQFGRVEVWKATHPKAIPLFFGFEANHPFFRKFGKSGGSVLELLELGLIHLIC